MIRYLLIGLSLSIGSQAFAIESVQFTNRELGAVFTLMRPELNSIELDGKKAIFNPSPSIKYLGVEASQTPLDLTVIGTMVDLRFNHIKAKTPEVKFQNGFFELAVPIEDQVKGIQSYLGSISFKDVVVRAQVAWQVRPNGTQELVLVKAKFEGSLKGTGVLRSEFTLSKVRELCVSLLTKSLQRFLSSDKIQNSVNTGLIEYAKFYTGAEASTLTDGSIQFTDDGIKYDVN